MINNNNSEINLTNEYSYKYSPITIKKLNILQEIYAIKIIEEINIMFNNFLTSLIPIYPKINNIVIKSYFKIEELIQRWCWHQYNQPDSLHNKTK